MSPTAVTRFDIVLIYYSVHSDLRIMNDYINFFKQVPVIVFFGDVVVSGAVNFKALSFKFEEAEGCRTHMETRYNQECKKFEECYAKLTKESGNIRTDDLGEFLTSTGMLADSTLIYELQCYLDNDGTHGIAFYRMRDCWLSGLRT